MKTKNPRTDARIESQLPTHQKPSFSYKALCFQHPQKNNDPISISPKTPPTSLPLTPQLHTPSLQPTSTQRPKETLYDGPHLLPHRPLQPLGLDTSRTPNHKRHPLYLHILTRDRKNPLRHNHRSPSRIADLLLSDDVHRRARDPALPLTDLCRV